MILITSNSSSACILSKKFVHNGFNCNMYPFLHMHCVDFDQQYENKGIMLCTSKNAIKALSQKENYRSFLNYRLITVGVETAKLATNIGFSNVEYASGDVFSLIDYVKKNILKDQHVYYLRARNVAQDIKSILFENGFSKVKDIICYHMKKIDTIDEQLVISFENGLIKDIIFMSQRTVESFVSIVEYYKIHCLVRNIKFHAISQEVAKKIPYFNVFVAHNKSLDSLYYSVICNIF